MSDLLSSWTTNSDDVDRYQKHVALKCLIAFAYATMHHIRREHGLRGDFSKFLPNIPELKYTCDREKLVDYLKSQHHSRRPSNAASHSPAASATPTPPADPATKASSDTKPDSSVVIVVPSLDTTDMKGGNITPLSPSPSFSLHRRGGRMSIDDLLGERLVNDADIRLGEKDHQFDYTCGCSRLPMEIANLLAAYVKERRRKDQIHFMVAAGMNGSIGTLTDAVSGLERILSTPVPLAYSLHLRHAVVLYLIFLPFLLLKDYVWWTIPLVTVASFTLMGIEHIGAEIENPFGRDRNDLPLEAYCDIIRQDVLFLCARPVPNAREWTEEALSYPAAPVATAAEEALNTAAAYAYRPPSVDGR
ncbi:hypothetical protein HK102_006633 [Quaeritorhiza haematococci]|nr:hypothetical protein HK102_006633 [Quaeritorhiza haematococci]